MTEDRWEQQPGGLYMSVSPFDKTNTLHQDAAASVMRRTVQTVAQTHGATFDQAGFNRNMSALYGGDIRVDFFLAKWDVCSAKPIYLGAALSWPTVGIDRQGNIKRGLYTEDVCLLTDRLRLLVQSKPKDKEFPEDSLVECFERISLQNMLANGEVFKFGEVDPDNIRAVQPQLKNGGVFGAAGDSAVLEFERLPNNLLDRFPSPVRTIGLKRDGNFDPNNFVVRWHEGVSDIRFIATNPGGHPKCSTCGHLKVLH